MKQANKSEFALLVENNTSETEKKANTKQLFWCTVSNGDKR
jgi:hypothetical protein